MYTEPMALQGLLKEARESLELAQQSRDDIEEWTARIRETFRLTTRAHAQITNSPGGPDRPLDAAGAY